MKTFAQKNWPDEDKEAVAYQLNFVSMCYGYSHDGHENYFKECCEMCKTLSVHYKDFEFPKANMKKPYMQLDSYFYAVSEELKNAIIEFGIDDIEKDVFRPIWTREHDKPIGFSIEPKHILKPIFKENNYELETICPNCNVIQAFIRDDDLTGRKDYNGMGRPLYISKDVLEDFHDFNYTCEFFGPGGYLLREVIVSKRIYDFIINLYPRAEFRPVLIKKELVETEEMKQKRLREQRLRKWRATLNTVK